MSDREYNNIYVYYIYIIYIIYIYLIIYCMCVLVCEREFGLDMQ